jgi:two-component system response regulator GlrR
MISKRALLLEVGADNESSSALQSILEPYFSFAVRRHTLSHPNNGHAQNGSNLEQVIRGLNPAPIFLLISHDTLSGVRLLLESIRLQFPHIPVIIVIEACEPGDVFELLKAGAADFITAPLRAADVLPRTWRLLAPLNSEQKPAHALKTESGLKQLVGESPVFLAQVNKIPLIARCEANVLIVGETGTGKELYARAIHYCSERAGKPFVPVNCGAIPVDLLENELFGHQRGAYTGAATLQPGLIEEADGGTLFLDEIDCLPVMAQVKLLRFLQDKEYRPLGATRMRKVDVRIIAASNLNLEEAVQAGKLRQDLYYRLNVVSLVLPPLRERREDISLLACHFLDKYAIEFGKRITGFAPEVLQSLILYGWPGNVRELEHVIERSIVLCAGPLIEGSDLSLSSSQPAGHTESLQQAKAKEIARFEKSYVQGLLSACRGNITRAAEVAQKNRRAFWHLIQKHQIDVKRFKKISSEP